MSLFLTNRGGFLRGWIGFGPSTPFRNKLGTGRVTTRDYFLTAGEAWAAASVDFLSDSSDFFNDRLV